jgi:hypothetical protein
MSKPSDKLKELVHSGSYRAVSRDRQFDLLELLRFEILDALYDEIEQIKKKTMLNFLASTTVPRHEPKQESLAEVLEKADIGSVSVFAYKVQAQAAKAWFVRLIEDAYKEWSCEEIEMFYIDYLKQKLKESK